MSTDLDTNIRSFLARIEDATPMAPPLSMLRMTEPAASHGRAIGIGVSVVVVAAGISGVAAVRLRDTPAAPAASVMSVTTVAATTTVAVVATAASPTDDPAGDLVMSANFFSLLDIQTPTELRTFLSGNIPESEVADCMHSAGYEYVEEPSEIDSIADDPRMTMSATDYAATYGFGSAAETLGLMPHRPLAEQAPNLAHVQSLTKDEQTEWFQAQHWCRGGYDTARLDRGEAYSSAIEQFREVLRSDPRVVEALATWVGCMRTAGHPFDDPQSMREVMWQRPKTGMSTDELQQLFTDEVAVAVANVPCEAPYTETYRAVATERFAEFRSLYDAALSAP